MKKLCLENKALRVEFNPVTGQLTRLVSKANGWAIHGREDLGLSFRMYVPVPGRRDNPVHGETQPLAACRLNAAKKELRLTWRNLRSEHGGRLDITFQGIVRLDERGLTFTARVQNRCGHVIENISWPRIGGLTPPPGTKRLSQMHLGYAGRAESELYPGFNNHRGYFGTDNPIQMSFTPEAAFVLMDSGRQGLYAGYHDTTIQHAVLWTFELKPGYGVPDGMGYGMVPRAKTIAGVPVRTEFSPTHFVFFNHGESGALQPVVLSPYVGDWHKGADHYKVWRKATLRSPPVPAWARELHSWQQIRVNSSEDDFMYPYKELVTLAKDCVKHGVNVIQVTGWNKGGQDRGNPCHDPDPNLGGKSALKKAIAECHKLGVRIVLFNKYTWADRAEPWYRKELHTLAARDMYGDDYVYGGYMYQTPTQLADISTRRLIPMCMQARKWREVCQREFAKSLDLGAAGILYDESQHHGPAKFCFDPRHGHHVPAHIFGGDEALGEGLRAMAKDRPEFLFAGEACYDLETQWYGFSYFRVGTYSTPMHRYVNPDAEMMVATMGYNDRTTLHQCLLYRYIISYEPRNFKGRLDEAPDTMAYGKRIDGLRRRYLDYLWNAECRDTVGATVKMKGGRGLYSVFVNPRTGRRAVVVVNNHGKESLTASVRLEGTRARLLLVSPERPDPVPAKASLTLAPLTAAVLLEGFPG